MMKTNAQVNLSAFTLKVSETKLYKHSHLVIEHNPFDVFGFVVKYVSDRIKTTIGRIGRDGTVTLIPYTEEFKRAFFDLCNECIKDGKMVIDDDDRALINIGEVYNFGSVNLQLIEYADGWTVFGSLESNDMIDLISYDYTNNDLKFDEVWSCILFEKVVNFFIWKSKQ